MGQLRPCVDAYLRLSTQQPSTMCGIFAYLNYDVEKKRSEVLEILFNGLRRLEYRGYDSAGVSVDSDPEVDVDLVHLANGSAGNGLCGQSVHGPPLVFREEGKIDNLVAKVAEGEHLRWRSKPSKKIH